MSKGSRLALTPMRRTMVDLMHFAKQVPTVICHYRMNLRPLIDARTHCPERLSWSSLFAKAFSLVALKHPELRQTYLPYPRPCLYEHPHSIAAITIERRIGNEDFVLFGHFQEPETHGLAQFNESIRGWKTDPLETIQNYQLARLSRYFPPFLRRFVWNILLNWVGTTRVNTFGTFCLTSTASAGAGMLQILSILTSTLHYGMFQPDGTIEMRLTFDHRVYDGAFAARVLGEMENTLLTDTLREVEGLASSSTHDDLPGDCSARAA
ncbi:MAG: 2-oxo acid dehydrogenase subunit E2 [Gemmataceae bacterium]